MDSQILVLNRWFEGIEEDESAFNEAPLWVQVWNLPVHWMSKEVGRKIGVVFNGVKEVIIPQTGSKEGRHIKLLVVADISQPLLRGSIVKVEGSTKWVSFKYERCPDFCYNCGIVGHSERNCKRLVLVDRGHLENQYGTWMRAGNGNGRNSPQKEPLVRRTPSDKHHWRLHNGNWVEVVKHKQLDPGQGNSVPYINRGGALSNAVELQNQDLRKDKGESVTNNNPKSAPKAMARRQSKEATIVASLDKLNIESEKAEERAARVLSAREKARTSLEMEESSQEASQTDVQISEQELAKVTANQEE
ncbi:uncharacterized protein LOC113777071 [Coffea eugenioides]|uniref:uncharacterized protein LOC113777071 n=1 Tax=Coffea eugenioides TaxID=49369 RepID=UPI000F60E538|nr:uncharacterized protein LOC113777071 [Coffea eugenioides]